MTPVACGLEIEHAHLPRLAPKQAIGPVGDPPPDVHDKSGPGAAVDSTPGIAHPKSGPINVDVCP